MPALVEDVMITVVLSVILLRLFIIDYLDSLLLTFLPSLYLLVVILAPQQFQNQHNFFYTHNHITRRR